jgi:hypothetical protein
VLGDVSFDFSGCVYSNTLCVEHDAQRWRQSCVTSEQEQQAPGFSEIELGRQTHGGFVVRFGIASGCGLAMASKVGDPTGDFICGAAYRATEGSRQDPSLLLPRGGCDERRLGVRHGTT